jgi:hypothetical protein
MRRSAAGGLTIYQPDSGLVQALFKLTAHILCFLPPLAIRLEVGKDRRTRDAMLLRQIVDEPGRAFPGGPLVGLSMVIDRGP